MSHSMPDSPVPVGMECVWVCVHTTGFQSVSTSGLDRMQNPALLFNLFQDPKRWSKWETRSSKRAQEVYNWVCLDETLTLARTEGIRAQVELLLDSLNMSHGSPFTESATHAFGEPGTLGTAQGRHQICRLIQAVTWMWWGFFPLSLFHLHTQGRQSPCE